MKKTCSVLAGLLALLLASCLPEEHFWWSPDGSHALVRTEDGLSLATADGTPGTMLSIDLGKGSEFPNRASWLPDGSGFVINRVRHLAKWEEVRALIPAAEAAEVEQLSRGVPDLMEAWAKATGTSDDGQDLMSWLPFKNKEVLSAAFFHAYETNREVMEAGLRKSRPGPKGEEVLEDLREESQHPFRVHEICLVKLQNGSVDGEPHAIARSLRALFFPKVSPKHPAVAFFHVSQDDDTAVLEVWSLDGTHHLEAVSEVSAAMDWMPDGRTLVFALPVMGRENTPLQNIKRVTVLHEDGRVLELNDASKDEERKLRSPVELAAALIVGSPRVIALPDGRVLFSCNPVTLPAPAAGIEVAPVLCLVSADGKKVETVPTAPGDLPTNLGYFATSPDGKRVAIVESDTDAVAVVELADGKTEIVSPAHANWQGRTMPAWKSSTELTFAALEKGVPKWVLWKQGEGVRSISAAWPAAATAKWLEEKKNENQPATTSP
ncbi:MAG: hypothetical protein ACAH88_07660 [Roseimicrobium sp.]